MQGDADRFIDEVLQTLVDCGLVDSQEMMHKARELETFKRLCKTHLLMHKLRIPKVYAVKE